MDNLLYYPYINLPKTDWTARALLYYNRIGSIVPQQYNYEPENYDPHMRELINSELVIPIDPMRVLDNPWEVSNPFFEYMESPRFNLRSRQRYFRRNGYGAIHVDKFTYNGDRINTGKLDGEIFYRLSEMGLAARLDHNWYIVERRTANELMTFLADVLGGKLHYQPTTDKMHNLYYSIAGKDKTNKDYRLRIVENNKRELILKDLIPYPQEIDVFNLRRFKDKHQFLLESFRNRVELIVLDPRTDVDTPLFDESLKELKIRKKELAAKMNESRLGQIIFGSICGLTGAAIGLTSGETPGAVLGGIPGFAHAVYSALQIERARDIPDQSGLKYLVLLDKKLRLPHSAR